jgi:D-glycero-D-manno-heptose 1,7-bisphosphate phosphatase
VVFDADDTLRTTLVPGQPCPRAPHEWALLPDVRETLARVPWAVRPDDVGPRLALASNQDQVAYGHLSHAMARRLLADLAEAAAGHRPPNALLQLCAHALEDPCDCRKPAPGMLLAAMRHAGVAPRETLFVGNAPTDREAARRAGIAFCWAWDFLAPALPTARAEVAMRGRGAPLVAPSGAADGVAHRLSAAP